MSDLQVSVVIPAHNEAENLAELLPEIALAMAGRQFEAVVVDDGSTDGTVSTIERLARQGFPVRLAKHDERLGQSAALWTGVHASRGAIIATLDGDGQNDPKYLPAIIAPLADPAIGLAAGRRVGRKDTLSKRVGSRLANGLRRGLLHDQTDDTGCGLKGFAREAFLRLPYFSTMHRFLPALFLGDGWRVVHVDVVDRFRRHGRSHYGNLGRLLVGLPDIFGVRWLLRRRRQSPFRQKADQNHVG